MSEERSRGSLQEKVGEQAAGRKKAVKLALIIGGVAAGVLIAACAALCGAAAARDTVFKGTTVLGMDVGGLTLDQIRETISEKGKAACEETGISLLMDGEEKEVVSLERLGVSVSAEDAARDAWAASHGGSFLTNGWNLLRSWFRETPVAPRLQVNDETLEKSVTELCGELGTPVVDGSYRLDQEKTDGLYVTKPRDGIQVNGELLSRAIRQAVESGKLEPIECSYVTVPAKDIDLKAVYEEIHGEMTNAGYDAATGELTDGRIGVEFDVTQAKTLLDKALAKMGRSRR